jgi:hypothetical protein
VERVVMIARLKPDGHDRARELIEQRQAGHYATAEFERQAIFLAPEEVIFFFEGADAARTVRRILNDPVRSTEIGHWIPLFDGPLHAAPESYYWERD